MNYEYFQSKKYTIAVTAFVLHMLSSPPGSISGTNTRRIPENKVWSEALRISGYDKTQNIH